MSAVFREGHVQADGFRIRYLEAGEGRLLVALHGAGGLRQSRAHDLLAEHYRVILFEAPGFGASPANERSASMAELGLTMAQAAAGLGLDRFNLMGTSFGGKLGLWLAVQRPELLETLVLVSPAALRPEGMAVPRPEQSRELLYAHPERQPPMPPVDEAVAAKQQALVQRLMGPPRDQELESRMAELNLPVLVLFGTADRLIPPSMGHFYKDLLPNCHLLFVYDAGHAIDGDRPEVVATVVGDFLARREAFLVKMESGLLYP
ncbi:MAG TPA: alpha/beta fold hydrolase [Chloroflexota bacterium]